MHDMGPFWPTTLMKLGCKHIIGISACQSCGRKPGVPQARPGALGGLESHIWGRSMAGTARVAPRHAHLPLLRISKGTLGARGGIWGTLASAHVPAGLPQCPWATLGAVWAPGALEKPARALLESCPASRFSPYFPSVFGTSRRSAMKEGGTPQGPGALHKCQGD